MNKKKVQKKSRKPILSKAVRDLRKAAGLIRSANGRLTDYRAFIHQPDVANRGKLRNHPDRKVIRHELEKADKELSHEYCLLFSKGLVLCTFIDLN